MTQRKWVEYQIANYHQFSFALMTKETKNNPNKVGIFPNLSYFHYCFHWFLIFLSLFFLPWLRICLIASPAFLSSILLQIAISSWDGVLVALLSSKENMFLFYFLTCTVALFLIVVLLSLFGCLFYVIFLHNFNMFIASYSNLKVFMINKDNSWCDTHLDLVPNVHDLFPTKCSFM